MSEWNVIHENFHTKHSVLTAPDEHVSYIIHGIFIVQLYTLVYSSKQHCPWLGSLDVVRMMWLINHSFVRRVWLNLSSQNNVRMMCFKHPQQCQNGVVN